MSTDLSDTDLKPKPERISLRQLAEDVVRDNGRRIKTEAADLGALKQKVEVFALNDLGIEQAYQRLPNVKHIINIANNFDPRAVLLPLVVRRKYANDELVIPDGQQRAIAAAICGYSRISCVVIEVQSIEDEAEIFRRLNIDRKSVPTPVTHRNDLLLGKERSLHLERAVQDAGYTVAEKGGNFIIRGVSRLHTTASYYGYDYVRDALRTYGAIWPDHKGVHLYLVGGIAMLLYAYRDRNAPMFYHREAHLVDATRIASRIRRRFLSPDTVVKVRKTAGDQEGSRPAEAYRLESDLHYARLLINAFNQGGRIPDGEKLDPNKVYAVFDLKKSEIAEQTQKVKPKRATRKKREQPEAEQHQSI